MCWVVHPVWESLPGCARNVLCGGRCRAFLPYAAVRDGLRLQLLAHVLIVNLVLLRLEIANLDASHNLHSRPCTEQGAS